MERDIVYRGVSPTGDWALRISGPSALAPQFYAQIGRSEPPICFWAFPFGFDAPVEELEVQWNLSDAVCGLLIERKCYGLFYYGPKQRRIQRCRARIHKDKPFNQDAIVAFAEAGEVEFKEWEGAYYVPGLQLKKCSWCRRRSDDFFVVVYDGASGSAEIQCEPVCKTCSESALDYINMRKEGVKRTAVLFDLELRDR